MINAASEKILLSFTARNDWSIQTGYQQGSDWINVLHTNGSAGKAAVEVVVKDNDTQQERVGYVLINTHSQSVKVSIKQKGSDITIPQILELKESYHLLGYRDTTIAIEVTHSHDFEVLPDANTESWLSYQKTKSEKDSVLLFRVESNSLNYSRSGFVVFKSRTNLNVKDTLFLEQKPTPEFMVTTDRFELSYQEEYIDIPIVTNCDVYVEIPTEHMSWIEYVDTLRNDCLLVRLKIANNNGFDSREAKIEIVANENTQLRKSIPIMQRAEKKLFLEQSSYHVSYKSGKINVPYRTNGLLKVNHDHASGIEVVVHEQFFEIIYPENMNASDYTYMIYLNLYENDPSIFLDTKTLTIIQEMYPFAEGNIPDYKPENWN